jgi:O-antigen/teichoic acid export membrane protein
MASLTRILKVLAALLTSSVVNLVTRLLLPPLFLYRYGATLYGEWLALAGAVAYLRTLNFGIQTYTTQDLTIRYQQKDMGGYHLRQSTALRILLGILGSAAIAALAVFALPAKSLLHLTIAQSTAAWTLYLLALQVLLVVLFGYFTGMYTVLSRAHTGVLWVNGQRLAMVLLTAFGVWRRWSFPALAACQLGTYAAGACMVLLHIDRVAPEIFPRLRGWDRSSVGAILKPSGYFGLISWSTFLSYEVPVLVLQREVGPFVVVAFTVMRTIYSMVRQALNAVTQSLAPEITRLYGREDWAELRRVYDYSERLLFALIPTANISVLVIAPVLLGVWLHRPGLFSVLPYLCMAGISMTLSAKEHKFQFQYSTNTHVDLARMMFASYVVLALLTIPMVHWMGMLGFLLAWLLVEIYQTAHTLQLNRRLFAATGAHTRVYLLRLIGLAGLGLVMAAWILAHTFTAHYRVQLAAGLGVCVIMGGAAFWLFHLRHLTHLYFMDLRERA